MQTELAQLFDEVPGDLLAHFASLRDAPLPDLLDARTAVGLTLDFREFNPVVRTLGGVILDDENTSNRHVYLSRPPLAGMVLWLPHDDASRIVFPSLREYRAAAIAARDGEGWIADHHPAESPRPADQAALGALIDGLLSAYDGSDGDEDTGTLVTALVPSLELRDLDLLARLASHEDFYLAEAVGNEIARRPSRDLAEVARLCASHPARQAAQAGERAVRAVRAVG